MAYYILRGIGYTLGVASVLIVLWSRQSESAYSGELQIVGYSLVVVSLLIFCASYVMYAMMARQKGPGPGGKRIISQ